MLRNANRSHVGPPLWIGQTRAGQRGSDVPAKLAIQRRRMLSGVPTAMSTARRAAFRARYRDLPTWPDRPPQAYPYSSSSETPARGSFCIRRRYMRPRRPPTAPTQECRSRAQGLTGTMAAWKRSMAHLSGGVPFGGVPFWRGTRRAAAETRPNGLWADRREEAYMMSTVHSPARDENCLIHST